MELDKNRTAKDKRNAFGKKKVAHTQYFNSQPMDDTNILSTPLDTSEPDNSQEEEKINTRVNLDHISEEDARDPGSPLVSCDTPTVHDLLYKKLKTYDSHVQYFLSYRIANFQSFIEQCLDDPNQILDALDEEKEDILKATRNCKSARGKEVKVDDLKMELCDRVPQIDRPNFSISKIIDIIPRLLFRSDQIKIERSMSAHTLRASTSAYLNSCGQYAYITGILIYEDLSLIHQAHGEMEYYKMEKDKEEIEVKLAKDEEQERTGTESTKDATFTSKEKLGTPNKEGTMEKSPLINKINNQTLSEVAEEDHGVSSRGGTFNSKTDQSISPPKISHDPSQASLTGSIPSNIPKIIRHSTMSNKMSSSDIVPDFDLLHHKIKKSEILGKSQLPKNKIKLPKILVLISKYPIFKDLEQFLTKIITH